MLTTEAATRKDATTRATLEHRHFATIAAIVAALPADCYGPEQIAQHFADELRATNPRFDRKRFLRACGVEA